MDVFEAIKRRRSIRTYLDRPIEKEKITKLLQAAQLAPSAKNRQEWKFIVVTDEKVRKELIPACRGQKFIAEAPVVIAGIADPTFRWYKLDMGIALEHVALEAVELGLGTCWIGAFDEKAVSRLLGVPPNLETVALLTVGYPREEGLKTSRKPLDEIVYYERYSLSGDK
ncbi:MAG TPA: nitroreductase [Thermoplasmatales archaeon]|nr:nitroreductase [Thermoplasmatales archaeon]